MTRQATEKEIAIPAGPNGKPTRNDKTETTAWAIRAIKQSRPRPWLVNNHSDALASGKKSAAKENPANIASALSHFGPNVTRIKGCGSARKIPLKRKLIKAIAQYTCKNVRR